MIYYNGDIQKLLNNFYNFLSGLGYNLEISGVDGDFEITCYDFSDDSDYGTGFWKYKISYFTYCSDLNIFMKSLKIIRKQNKNGLESVTNIYQYDGDVLPRSSLKFKDCEWLECLLSCMIPYKSYKELLERFELSDYDDDYKSIARDIKIKILLNYES